MHYYIEDDVQPSQTHLTVPANLTIVMLSVAKHPCGNEEHSCLPDAFFPV